MERQPLLWTEFLKGFLKRGALLSFFESLIGFFHEAHDRCIDFLVDQYPFLSSSQNLMYFSGNGSWDFKFNLRLSFFFLVKHFFSFWLWLAFDHSLLLKAREAMLSDLIYWISSILLVWIKISKSQGNSVRTTFLGNSDLLPSFYFFFFIIEQSPEKLLIKNLNVESLQLFFFYDPLLHLVISNG